MYLFKILPKCPILSTKKLPPENLTILEKFHGNRRVQIDEYIQITQERVNYDTY